MMNPQPSAHPRPAARNHRKKTSRQEELGLLQQISDKPDCLLLQQDDELRFPPHQAELELLLAISDKLDYLLLQQDEELRFPHHEHYLETLLNPE